VAHKELNVATVAYTKFRRCEISVFSSWRKFRHFRASFLCWCK